MLGSPKVPDGVTGYFQHGSEGLWRLTERHLERGGDVTKQRKKVAFWSMPVPYTPRVSY